MWLADILYTSELRWLLSFTLIFCFLYQYVLKTWWYFDKRNVKYERGWPLLGIFYHSMFGLENIAYVMKRIYDKHPNERFIGMYDFMGRTSYMIRDPKLIKQVTTTHFDHFVNHRFQFDDNADPLASRTLISLRDNKWRRMRATVSVAFTGNKMRLMHRLIVDCSINFIDVLKKHVASSETDGIYEASDLLRRYANDVIGTCAFGIKINSLVDPDNIFFRIGGEVSGGLHGLKFLGFVSVPWLMKLFNASIVSSKHVDFFRSIIMNNIQQRIENKIVRNDIIDLMMKARGGDLKEADEEMEREGSAKTAESQTKPDQSTETLEEKLTDDDLVAQCMVFFLGGYKSVSTATSFLAHELAVNPDVQQKLYEEIREYNKYLQNGPLDYSTLTQMKYMDMVIMESLRRWSPGLWVDRVVTKPYVMENTDGTRVQLNVGDGIWIPKYALHMDEQYFADPEKFDPERFNDENKDNICSGTYLPFGIGPRACIATRFSILEMKTLFFYILLNFTIKKCEKTQDPLRLKRSATEICSDIGIWIRLVPRKTAV